MAGLVTVPCPRSVPHQPQYGNPVLSFFCTHARTHLCIHHSKRASPICVKTGLGPQLQSLPSFCCTVSVCPKPCKVGHSDLGNPSCILCATQEFLSARVQSKPYGATYSHAPSMHPMQPMHFHALRIGLLSFMRLYAPHVQHVV